ncbi:MAG: thioredoxin domain-containing protein [Gemmatimonadaceae bacterium]|nr:thioredoxin domain-containing protein [Gemmatimonadaceae bacterium]
MSDLCCPVSNFDHVIGPVDAPVTLLQYGDFHCPWCREAYPIVRALRRSAGAALRVAFRHFPITEFHRSAPPAAQAAESAAVEEKFWEIHSALFERPPLVSTRALLACARDIGLDTERVASDLARGEHVSHVAADFLSGVRSGVYVTPAIFINGVRFNGRWDLESLERAIARATLPERIEGVVSRATPHAAVVRRRVKSRDDFRWCD